MLVRIKNSKTGTVMSVPDPSVMGPGWEVVTDGSGDSAGRRGVDAPASVRDGDAVSERPARTRRKAASRSDS